MNRMILVCLGFFAACFLIDPRVRSAEPPATATVPDFARRIPEYRSGDPMFQFNGKDLSGFYTYTNKHHYEDPDRVFTVENGMIHVSGTDFGGFATGGNFGDYHLIVEWKWGEKTYGSRLKAARDSGILLHCVGKDGAAGGQWMESIECQIIEGGCGDFIMVGGEGKPSLTCTTRRDPAHRGELWFDPAGKSTTRDSGRYNWWGRDPNWKDVLGYRGPSDVENKPGDWNRMEVICRGDSITNIVNGYVVNVGTKCSRSEGKIQFQSEGAEIYFRKIEVRPLLP